MFATIGLCSELSTHTSKHVDALLPTLKEELARLTKAEERNKRIHDKIETW